MRRTFPVYGAEGEEIFKPDIHVIKTGDYVMGHLHGEIVLGRIIVKRMIIKSIIELKIHTGKRLGNKKHLITISDIICFTRTLTPKKLKENLPEFFI